MSWHLQPFERIIPIEKRHIKQIRIYKMNGGIVFADYYRDTGLIGRLIRVVLCALQNHRLTENLRLVLNSANYLPNQSDGKMDM
jgi:hypothetical protein